MAGISVVIPTYNRAHLIGETLDAVFGQTLAADEVIVIDDGSGDNTLNVLAGYGDRVRTIRIENSGDLVARNVGTSAAQGRLVAFCDSDDMWLPEFLATMSQQWQSEPKLTACYSNFYILQDGRLSTRSKFEDAPKNYWTGLEKTGPDAGKFECNYVERLVAFQPFFPSCMVVSRQAFLEAGGWDEGVSRLVGCDFATMLRVAALPPVGVVHRSLVAIRKHASNVSGDTEKMNLGDADVLEYVLRTRPELSSLADTIRNSIAQRRGNALDSAFSRRDFAAVRRIYNLLPSSAQSSKHRAKRLVSAFPSPINALIAAAISR